MHNDITPRNGWLFTVASPAVTDRVSNGNDIPGSKGRTQLVMETVYAGSRAVEFAVKSVAGKNDEDTQFITVSPFPQKLFVGTHRRHAITSKGQIMDFLLQAQQQERNLFIGFSVWTGQQALDVFNLLQFTREKSDGRAVCVVGGTALLNRNPYLEERLFAVGADIINIGGGADFSKWFGNLRREDSFERGKDGGLYVTLPKGAPFFTANSNRETKAIGKHINPPAYFDLAERSVAVTIPGINCANACGFCSIGPDRHKHNASQFGKISEFAKKVDKYILDITKYCKGELPSINLNNPNPMQRMKALETFLSTIDLSRISTLLHFSEAPALINKAGIQRHLRHMDELLTKNPELRLSTTFSLDAFQYHDDNEFLQKTMGSRILCEDDFTAIISNYLSFLDEVGQRDWRNRVSLGTNFIYHPAMTPDVYLRKINFEKELSGRLGYDRAGCFILFPDEESPIGRDWKDHYAPMLYMEEGWMPGHSILSAALSNWGNQFKHGDLLDCFVTTRLFCGRYNLPQISRFMSELLTNWNGRNPSAEGEDIYYQPGEFDISADDIALAKELALKIADEKGPRILKFFDFLTEQVDSVPREMRNEAAGFAKDAYVMMDWVRRREQYLMDHNKVYARNPNCKLLVEKTTEMMSTFKPYQPYIKQFDERPRRATSLKSPTVAAVTDITP